MDRRPARQARALLVELGAFTRVSSLGVEGQRINVVIELTDPCPARASLADGYRIEDRIVTCSSDDALTVPMSGSFRRVDGWAACAVEDGEARLRPVEAGHLTDSRVQMTKGIVAGDRVINHPSDRVTEGVEVKAR